jgi:hypothetical protein
MPPFLYRCPTTGYRVQNFISEEIPAEGDSYEPLTCIACQRVHLEIRGPVRKLLGNLFELEDLGA